MKNKNKKVLTRRDFVRGTVSTIIGSTVLGVNWVSGQDKVRSSLVTIVRDKNVLNKEFEVDRNILKKMLDQTVIQFTGKKTAKEAWLSIVKPDDLVGLVPTPHLNPTHKELEEVLTEALRGIGIPKHNIVDVQKKREQVNACTALISIPGLKAHWLTGIGTVMKNYIMYSGRPTTYHAENNAKLGEIWHLPAVKGKTKLILVDALYPLCDKGPQPDPRYKWAYNGLIAGTDPVAVERVCLEIITKKRTALRGEPWPLSPPPLCIESADKIYGLGTSKLEEIKIQPYGWKEDLLI